MRRIEAVTGPEAYDRLRRDERTLREAAALLRTKEENLLPRLQQLVAESRDLAKALETARAQGGGDVVGRLIDGAVAVGGAKVIASPVDADGADELRALGDVLRERLGSGVAVLAGVGERPMLMAVVTDDMIGRGVRADALVREVAAIAGGRGGGKPHMAQAGVTQPERVPDALAAVVDIVRPLLAGAGAAA